MTNLRQRRSSILLAIAALVTAACGSAPQNEADDPLTALPGVWESSYGTFTFTSGLTYSVTADDAVIETGTYRLIGNLLSLVGDADSAECAGETDTLRISVESADVITVGWEAVGCEAHFVLDCFLPGGGGEGCGRFDRVSD